MARTVHPFDDYRLAALCVDGRPVDPSTYLPIGALEEDLFAGLRAEVSA